MKDELEIVLAMYKVQVARSEHYEGLRAALTNVILGLSAALVALATFDNALSFRDSWLGAVIMWLGVVGYIASRLHSTRSSRHGHRAAAYRDMLDKLAPAAGINVVRQQVTQEPTRLNSVWSLVHLGVVATGAIIVGLSLLSPF